MIRVLSLAALMGLPSAVAAQDGVPLVQVPQTETQTTRDRVQTAGGAVVRALDKLTGEVGDVPLTRGETKAYGRVQITLGECRYPANNPSGDAYAYLVVREAGVEEPVFSGWMIASSPALSAMEHPRYDVWVLRCSR